MFNDVTEIKRTNTCTPRFMDVVCSVRCSLDFRLELVNRITVADRKEKVLNIEFSAFGSFFFSFLGFSTNNDDSGTLFLIHFNWKRWFLVFFCSIFRFLFILISAYATHICSPVYSYVVRRFETCKNNFCFFR